jgi:hypothetical protein
MKFPCVWLILKTNVSGHNICPTFRVKYFVTLMVGHKVGPETLVFKINQTPGNYPKEDNLNKWRLVSNLRL